MGKRVYPPLMSPEDRRKLIEAPLPTFHTAQPHVWAGVLIEDHETPTDPDARGPRPEDESELLRLEED